MNLDQQIAAAFMVPSHSLGQPFVPTDQEEAEDLLLAHAEMFKAATGVEPEDQSPDLADIVFRRRLAEFEAMNAAHDRWWSGVQERRARYGYGLTGRVHEWWGERRLRKES